MARTRRQNRKQHTSAEHEITISKREVLFVSWLLVQKEGLGREETRYVSNIVEVLDLDRDIRFKPDELDEEQTFSLSGYELSFLKGFIDDLWEGKKMPPNQAVACIEFYDYIDEMLKGLPDEEKLADTVEPTEEVT